MFVAKYYMQYMVPMGLLMVNSASLAIDDSQNQSMLSGRAHTVWVSLAAVGLIYGLSRFVIPEVYKRITPSEDVSPEIQAWANKVAQEAGIDIDAISLKKGSKEYAWMAALDSVIFIPEDFNPHTCSEHKLLFYTMRFKHEIGHIKSGDYAKAATVVTATCVSGLLLTKETSSLIILPAVIAGYGMNMMYWRYIEGQADRFAYERAASKEELEAAKNKWLKCGHKFTYDLLTDPSVRKKANFIEKKMLYGISGKLKDIQKRLVNSTEKSEVEALEHKKEFWIDAASFMYYRDHPSFKSRANMAQEYIDKWDKERAQKHFTALFETATQP